MTSINPMKSFVKDLGAMFKNAKQKWQDMILTWDFNEHMGENLNDLSQLILGMELIDVHTHKHRFDCNISILKESCQWLDFIFISRHLTDHFIHFGFKRVCMHLVTDHWSYFVDLSIQIYSITDCQSSIF